MNNIVFPVKNHSTYIPDGFKCYPLDMSLPEFNELALSGCSSITMVNCPAGWNIARRGDLEERHIDLFFIESGCIKIHTAQEIINARAGDILQVISWEDRYLEQTDAGKHIYVCFNNPEHYPKINVNKCRKCNAIEHLNFYSNALLTTNINLQNEKLYRQFMVQLIHILLQRELHWLSSAKSDDIQKLQNLLKDPHRRNFEVLPIARQMGMSFTKFRNFCLENFRKPPRQVVEEIRMSKARGMLDYTLLTVDDISEQLGFSDRFAFSKAFTRHHKIAPVSYRNRFNK